MIRQPRPIGRTRPSSRAPPSIIAANTIPPKITISGWAKNTTSAVSAAKPIQIAAFCASRRNPGSWMSAGLSRA